MIIINAADILRIVKLKDILRAVEEAFLVFESGNFSMPERMHADYKGNTLLLMPSFTDKYFSTKLVSIFPENVKNNIPTLQGVFVLNDGKSGIPLAIIDAAKLTALRTGGVGGVSIKYLTDPSVKRVGIIGAGVQGYHQALFSSIVREIESILIYDKNKNNALRFIERFKKERPEISLNMAESPREVIENSEIIITATTSLKPVVPDDSELLKEKYFIGIGSYKPTMREYPDSLFKVVDKVFVDTKTAFKESGDLREPISKGLIEERDIQTLGAFIKNPYKIGRNSTIFFKSVGMAIFDLFVGAMIYEYAREKGGRVDEGKNT